MHDRLSLLKFVLLRVGDLCNYTKNLKNLCVMHTHKNRNGKIGEKVFFSFLNHERIIFETRNSARNNWAQIFAEF